MNIYFGERKIPLSSDTFIREKILNVKSEPNVVIYLKEIYRPFLGFVILKNLNDFIKTLLVRMNINRACKCEKDVTKFAKRRFKRFTGRGFIYIIMMKSQIYSMVNHLKMSKGSILNRSVVTREVGETMTD